MKIEPFQLADLQTLDDLRPDGWDDLKPVYRFYYLSSFCDPVKMSDGNRLLAVSCGIRHVRTAWIGHLVVHPDFQGQGIGTRMTAHSLASLQLGGYRSISLVATPVATAMYERFGFQFLWTYRFFQSPQQFKPPKKPELIVSYQDRFLAGILDLDRKVSGEDRKHTLAYHLDKARAYIDNKIIRGAYFPTLGEGMVIARDQEAGSELIKHRMLEKSKAVVPEQNIPALNLIESMGMQEYRQGIRMSWGIPVVTEPLMLYNRIGGNMG